MIGYSHTTRTKIFTAQHKLRIRHLITDCLLLCAFFLNTTGFAAEAPVWSDPDPLEANEGHVLLSWQPVAAGAEYEVEQVDVGGERVLRYRGPDLAYFTTGLNEGAHTFRVRESGGVWSEPLSVTVDYPPMSHLLLGLVSGALLLGITVGAIGAGYRLTRTEEKQEQEKMAQ